MKFNKPIYFIILAIGILFISFKEIKKSGEVKTELPENEIAASDSFQLLINDYCILNLAIDSLDQIIEFKRAVDKKLLARIEKLRLVINSDSSAKNIDRLLSDDPNKRPEIIQYDSMTDLLARKFLMKEIEMLLKERGERQLVLKSMITGIRTFTKKITGSREVLFYGVKYHLFVADLDSNKVRIHLMHQKARSSLGNVKEFLELQKIQPLMITNAGMYTMSYEPEGLYIEENSPKKYSLDMGSSTLGLNFYLKPNGVFYIDNKNIPHIDSTQEFARLQKVRKIKVKMATQSGPMLVINGRIHPAFTKGSHNKKIRSGVGIVNNKKVVFALTMSGSNFYDFSIFLRDIFSCKNALFLDGAISRMYLHDIDSTETGGEFGPIISVSRKNKK